MFILYCHYIFVFLFLYVYILTYNSVFSEFTKLWVAKGFKFGRVWKCEEGGDNTVKWFGFGCMVEYATKNASEGFRFHN